MFMVLIIVFNYFGPDLLNMMKAPFDFPLLAFFYTLSLTFFSLVLALI